MSNRPKPPDTPGRTGGRASSGRAGRGSLSRHPSGEIHGARVPRRPDRRGGALETLYDVGRALGSTLDFEAVLERVAALSRSTIGSETASVMLADEATGDLRLVCAQGLPPEVRPGTHLPSSGIAEWVLRHGEPVRLVGNPAADPRFRHAGNRGHIRSALSVPIVGKGGPIGVLSLNNSVRRRAFTHEDLELLTALGTQAGIAVENARLHHSVEEANRQLTVTVEHLRNLKFSLTGMTDSSTDVALQTMLDAAIEGTGARSGSLAVLDEGDAVHVIEASYYGEGIRIPANATDGWGEVEASIHAASDQLRDTPFTSGRSLLRVLMAQGRPIGLLKLLAAADSPGFNDDDREFVNALVEHAATVLYNSMLYQEAQAGREALEEAYAELQQKQDQLIQSEKLAAIGQLAARVCHEINNPLTAISGCAQLMQRKLRGEGGSLGQREVYERYLQTMLTETERCSGITGNLLRFAHQPEPCFAEADLHYMLSHTISVVEMKYPDRLEVVADFDFGVPPLFGDPQQLAQVFLNLLSNAAEAMPQGGLLTVSTRTVEAAGGSYVAIAVRDRGAGIPFEDADHLFEPFYTTKSTGTGLGLAICRSIVERHHGLIALRAAPDGGAVATVILPLDAASAPARPDPGLLDTPLEPVFALEEMS